MIRDPQRSSSEVPNGPLLLADSQAEGVQNVRGGKRDTGHTAFSVLSTHGARSLNSAPLPCGAAYALWENPGSEVAYRKPGHHILSVYTLNGQQTELIDRGRVVGHGYPGAVCSIPAQSESLWRSHDLFRFLHLYYDDTLLSRIIAKTWDTEPNIRALCPTYLFEDVQFVAAAHQALAEDWVGPLGRMALDHLAHALLVRVAAEHSEKRRELPRVRGTLSGPQKARIEDYIAGHVDQVLAIDDLASQVGLSPYHFSRLFRASFGLSPARYIQKRRLELGHRLLVTTTDKITSIAFDCGFGDHSAFTRAFRRHFGYFPQAVRHST